MGQICDANREFFHEPRLDGYDVALLKNFAFSKAKRPQLRIEGFDVFNHAEFANPSGSYTPQQLWRANIDIYFAHWAIEFEVLF